MPAIEISSNTTSVLLEALPVFGTSGLNTGAVIGVLGESIFSIVSSAGTSGSGSIVISGSRLGVGSGVTSGSKSGLGLGSGLGSGSGFGSGSGLVQPQ